MQKKNTQKIIAAVVLLLLVVVLVGTAVGKTAFPAPASSAVSSEEASSSDVEDRASSEAASSSDVVESSSTVPEENAASEEALESGAGSEKNGASSSGSAAASRETAASSAHSQASSSHAASSSHTSTSSSAASSSAASSTTASSIIESIESLGDAQIDSYVDQIQDLQKRSQRALYQIMRAAYDEYMQYPKEKRTLTLKVSIVLGKTVELSKTQSQCDKEFKVIIKELRKYLRDNGYDQSIADTAETEYKAKKDALTKELTDLTYSQVTGSGDGAHWLNEHYDEMMGD